MKITITNGTEIDLTISGFQENHTITVKPFVKNRIKIRGQGIIQHRKGIETGLLFHPRNTIGAQIFVRCGAAMEEIYREIEKLPHNEDWVEPKKVSTGIDNLPGCLKFPGCLCGYNGKYNGR